MAADITYEMMLEFEAEVARMKATFEARMSEASQLYPEEIVTYGPNTAFRRKNIRESIANEDYYGILHSRMHGEYKEPNYFTRTLPTETDWELAERQERDRVAAKAAVTYRDSDYNSFETKERKRLIREEREAADEVIRWMGPCGCSNNDFGGCSVCDEQRRAWDRWDALNRKLYG